MNELIQFKLHCHRNCCRGTVQKLSSKTALNVSEERHIKQVSLQMQKKEASDDIHRTLGGKEFQAHAVAKGNARSPRVDRWVDGMTSVDVLADLSQRRETTSVDRWSVSERYDGTRPCRH